MLLELQQIRGKRDVRLQEVLRIHAISLWVGAVLFNIQADGSTAAARARESEDNAAAVIEFDVKTLVFADTTIEIGIFEVTGVTHSTIYEMRLVGRFINEEYLSYTCDF